MTRQRGPQAACSAVAIASFGAICATSAGPVRQIAGLSLIASFALALWSIRRGRFDAIVPATGLTLTFLILTGLALAAVHVLNTVAIALALAIATLVAAWAGASAGAWADTWTGVRAGVWADTWTGAWTGAARPTARRTSQLMPGPAERRAWFKPPSPLALVGVLIFAAATVLAVRYSAASATADADRASSVAIWAYPSGDQLKVGVQEPAGHSATSLRIVVSRAGVTIATWNDIRLAPGQAWNAPALTVAGNGPLQVVALHGETVVAHISTD